MRRLRIKWPLIIIRFRALIVGAIFLGIIATSILLGFATSNEQYPELDELKQGEMAFQEYQHYFRTLAQEKGAIYAFEVLKGAPFVPTVHTHLIGHEIGDVLWEQEGELGIRNCSEHFRNACSHSIVGILVRKEGTAGIPRIFDVCKKSGGGVRAFEQCIHGVGHGVLAAVDYDFENAMRECERGSVGFEGTLALAECVGGVSMELASGGGHNEELYEAQAKRFFRDDDPLAPCSAPFLPDAAQPGCLEYFTTHLFVAAGANRRMPTPEFYERAIILCAAAPEGENRSACYRGFGREFVNLAQSGDARRVEQAITETYARVHAWCAFAQNPDGVSSCIAGAVSTIFLNGEEVAQDAVRFCVMASLPEGKERCWESIVESARIFLPEEKKLEFCGSLPESVLTDCVRAIDTPRG